jgi:Cu-Zn family superoxide dismutase
MKLASVTVAATAALGLGALALAQSPSPAPSAAAKPSATSRKVTRAVAVLHPTQGNKAEGTVWFAVGGGGVTVKASLKGLAAGAHGFHVHEFGDCTAPDAASAGGHFNPTGEPHGAPTDAHRHAGDLGNVQATADGTATLEWTDPKMKLDSPDGVIGRGVIVHSNPDDLKTQPTGNAGGRVACGVVGVAKSE